MVSILEPSNVEGLNLVALFDLQDFRPILLICASNFLYYSDYVS